jgi:CubicO group peptidase (beta-lactamase class C family)
VAQIIHPQLSIQNPVFNLVAPWAATLPLAAGFGSLYFPGMRAAIQGDTPLLDGEIPSANGVATARGLARMYGALANGGQIDGRQYLSGELAAGLVGQRSLCPDRGLLLPVAFHLGYHTVPIPGVMPGFGHVGMGGCFGWASPASRLAFAFVHNRLLTPFVFTDQAGFLATAALIRRSATEARRHGYQAVADFGAPFVPQAAPVAG